MSLSLKIDRDENTFNELADYLQDVIIEIRKGNVAGYDWDIEGDEELEDEPYEEPDFTGATPDNGEGR